ncbi:MAG: DNA polymerase IV [Kiritimatiellae bacterium]|nr:DNA polymerase IV [Kiritimatiellia bacterium]
MTTKPLRIDEYPRAILHLDADAFFTSVEQAITPALRGKPVITGKERGIVACASYEAKAMGIKRGIPLFQAREICPGLIILPNDYETYSLYSKRMFNIVRKFTPVVEEYSVDEAFADLTGLRRIYRCSYEEIARRIQKEIENSLGLTVSVGLSLSKSLAKLCSKFRKPRGFTAIPGRDLHLLLANTPLEKVWGFGDNTVSLLRKYGLQTAYDFVLRPEKWVSAILHKPGREIWHELRGNSIWEVEVEEKSAHATILKSKTFTPPSSDRAFVYAKLVRNVESAFARARRHNLRTGLVGIALRHNDFQHDVLEAKLNRPTSSHLEAIPLIRELFNRLFAEKALYRATLVVLAKLEPDGVEQLDFFEDRLKVESLHRLTLAIDEVNRRYGKHTVCCATALYLKHKPHSSRDEQPERRERLSFAGETPRQRVAIPRMDIAV